MKCRYCGKEIPEGALYCKACGREVFIVPEYNPLDDMLTEQIRDSIDGTGREEDYLVYDDASFQTRATSARRNTGRTVRTGSTGRMENTGRTRNTGRMKNTGRTAPLTKEQKRRQAEKRKQKRRKKRRKVLLIMALILAVIVGISIVLYQNSYTGIVAKGNKVNELVERYIKQKQGVRESTRAGYKTVINTLKKDPFGERFIDEIRISDAKLWLIELQENGKKYSTIHTIRGVVRPAFQMALEDDILDKNPFAFELATILVNYSETREALTRKQERQFLEFVKNDKHFSRYYEAIYILFKTGMRISEFCGLTISDINMRERTINIDHQLLRTSGMKYIIEDTKSTSGTRVLPMTNEVYECFKTIWKPGRNQRWNRLWMEKLVFYFWIRMENLW